MRRREFLKTAGYFVASAAVPLWSACGDDADADAEAVGIYDFPQGVASGDPRPSSVMLWTRVVLGDPSAGDDDIELTVELSETQNFAELLLNQPVSASAASDFTVRVLATDLEPGKIYFYRFRAGSDLSRVGRTQTAPAPDADVEVRFAWVSCQDYSSNYYSAYRQLLNDDADKPAREQLQFVMHLGDFIYETRDAGFMLALDDDLNEVMLSNKAGEPRVVPAFPTGGATNSADVNYANSVEDYRHIYKTYLADRDLQDARARWPFICTWDDHEFSDDCWQTQTNYDRKATTDEPAQKRRVAASQAWFEYVPSALSDLSEDDPGERAKDFKAVSVEDAPYSAVIEVDEPNNQTAIGAITLYRSLRFGRHMALVLTDSRSYRSDHALAEDLTKSDLLIFHPRAALPKEAVNIADAGRTANGGQPPDKAGRFENLRKDSPPGTLLGAAQKQWWKDVMAGSDATFKVWGNPVPLMRLLLDGSHVTLIKEALLLSPDAWDGYNTERKELMAYLKERDIRNVVSLAGDHHAHYAGVIYDDFDAAEPSPVMVELVGAGISSTSQFAEIAGAFDAAVPQELAMASEDVAGVRRVIVYDATKLGGSDKAVVNMNTLLRYGSAAANEAATSNDLAKIEAKRDPAVNPHLRYADARATGYGLAHVSADRIEASLVTIERQFEDRGTASPGIYGTAAFTIARAESWDDVALPEPELTGKKPFPLA